MCSFRETDDISGLTDPAIIRYVNHLDDEDFNKRETISVLRALRVNVSCRTDSLIADTRWTLSFLYRCRTLQLKMAIDNSLLPAFDSSLLSSYLQVLIMSEGDIWIHKAVHEVALWLRTWEVQPSTTAQPIQVDHSQPSVDTEHTTRKRALSDSDAPPFKQGPVHKAESLISSFCTKELKNVPLRSGKQGGLGVDEYVANSTMDLVLMAGWTVLSESIPGGLEALPVSLEGLGTSRSAVP